MEKLLQHCPVVIETPVAWGEMDAFRHLNNTAYFRYFESARIAYFERLNLLEYMEATGVGPILASTSCRFKIPLTYPDKVFIGARIPTVEDDRFTMEYYVVSHKHQRVAAEGVGLIVCFNYKENKKAPIPDELKRRIEELESKTREASDTIRKTT
ncbi:MAG TPA: thioesterase family protein [Pyrinomonadaceae bacterium]|nr:thioesterase family protein [Pyrinomonadaceae bacterium]